MTGCYQVQTTFESEAEASRMAATLVEERLAACVQIIGPVASVYRWEGAVTRATEWLCSVKTAESRIPALLARIRELHSYRQPEIVATRITTGDPQYLEWVVRESSAESERW